MKEDKTVGKSIGSALIVILALVIVVELVCCGLIYFVFNGESSGSSVTSEQTPLKVSQPGKKEMSVSDSISITAEGYVKKQKKKTETKKTETKKTESKKKETKKEEKADTGDYICPTSSSTQLTDADIKGLSSQQLNYAKNEIYARHGRMFDSQELQDYFNSKSWYKGLYSASDFDANYNNLLTDIERKNVEFLRNAESNASSGGYTLDE